MTDQFYDVTAISFHAYPYIQENYTLMPCGGSVGDSYGPMIVAPKKLCLLYTSILSKSTWKV